MIDMHGHLVRLTAGGAFIQLALKKALASLYTRYCMQLRHTNWEAIEVLGRIGWLSPNSEALWLIKF